MIQRSRIIVAQSLSVVRIIEAGDIPRCFSAAVLLVHPLVLGGLDLMLCKMLCCFL